MAHQSDHNELFQAARSAGYAFDARDRELDSQLAAMLRKTGAAPVGLSDRVHAASAALLPMRETAPQLRFVPAPAGSSRQRVVVRRRVLSRVAMAASVALACAIGIYVCTPGGTGTTMAAADPSATDAGWDVFARDHYSYSEMAYLLETDTMTLDEVTGEMSRLASGTDAGM